MAGLPGTNTSELLDLARSLTPLQRQIVTAIQDRGPGMPLEIAVRVLKFPEQISQPLADLREKGVVTGSEFSGGTFGNELILLTATGERLARSLRDESFRRQLTSAETLDSVDSLQQEAALQRKLGELAERQGDLASATRYYQQALQTTQRLNAAP